MYWLRYSRCAILKFCFLQDCSEIKRNSSLVNCTENEFRCLMNKFYCIHKSWMCDGDPDCPDESDESVQVCGAAHACRSDQFTCDNGECIPGFLQCSGQPECSDGSDEKLCRKSLLFRFSFSSSLALQMRCTELLLQICMKNEKMSKHHETS